MTLLKGYDAWKTRSDLDDAQRGYRGTPADRCAFCGAPLPDAPWASWNGGRSVLLCGQCAAKDEPDER